MAWIQGSATVTGVQELADILAAAVIGISLQTIDAIADAGTGYVVGDFLTLTGGTSRVTAVAEVLTVGGGGEVTAARIYNAGIYDVAPANDVVTSGGTGSGCELTCTFDHNGWECLRATNAAGSAQSATVATAGTGYVAGETLTLNGGVGHTPATFTILTVGGSGEVLTVAVDNYGSYSTNPSNPNAVTGGSGTGCELTVTFGGSGEREYVFLGEGSGSDEVFVGWAARESGAVHQLDLAGMTGYLAATAWDSQPGMSPIRSGTNGGCFCPTVPQATTWWVSVTPRRIAFVYRVLSFYGSGHLGLLNPYFTGGEWPYPLLISGYSNNSFGGISQNDQVSHLGSPGGEAIGTSESSNTATQSGGGSLYLPSGSWQGVCNTIRTTGVGGSHRGLDREGYGIWPGCSMATSGWPSAILLSGAVLLQPFTPFGFAGTALGDHIIPTTNSGGNLFLRVPCTVMKQNNSTDILIIGRLDGVYSINTGGALVAENRIREGDDFFRVFSAGTRTDWKFYFCVAER